MEKQETNSSKATNLNSSSILFCCAHYPLGQSTWSHNETSKLKLTLRSYQTHVLRKCPHGGRQTASLWAGGTVQILDDTKTEYDDRTAC